MGNNQSNSKNIRGIYKITRKESFSAYCERRLKEGDNFIEDLKKKDPEFWESCKERFQDKIQLTLSNISKNAEIGVDCSPSDDYKVGEYVKVETRGSGDSISDIENIERVGKMDLEGKIRDLEGNAENSTNFLKASIEYFGEMAQQWEARNAANEWGRQAYIANLTQTSYDLPPKW